jgi:hypothetical protein
MTLSVNEASLKTFGCGAASQMAECAVCAAIGSAEARKSKQRSVAERMGEILYHKCWAMNHLDY